MRTKETEQISLALALLEERRLFFVALSRIKKNSPKELKQYTKHLQDLRQGYVERIRKLPVGGDELTAGAQEVKTGMALLSALCSEFEDVDEHITSIEQSIREKKELLKKGKNTSKHSNSAIIKSD